MDDDEVQDAPVQDAPVQDAPAQLSDQMTRIKALSDGVIAIVITLLAFEIRVPELGEGQSLLAALGAQWPIYLGFAASYATIYIIWVNHQRMLAMMRTTDHNLTILNGLMLLSIALIPFGTLLLVEFYQTADRHVAAMIYSGVFLLIAASFNLMFRYAVRARLLVIDEALSRFIRRQYLISAGMYSLAFSLAAFNVTLSLLLNLGLALYYALPIAGGLPVDNGAG
jgi:uncharacterized membrane protein